MIDLYYLQIPSLEDFERHKNNLIRHLPKEDQELSLQKDFNKTRLSSFLGKIVVYYLAKQKIDSFQNIPFSFHSQGKPFFKEYPDFHFNISHSTDYVVVGISDNELGVDIERIREYKKSIAERFLHPEEFQFLESLDADKQSFAFSSIWNLKESYVKYTGEGIANTFKEFAIDCKDNSTIQISGNTTPVSLKLLQEISGYLVSVCSLEAQNVSISRLALATLI